MPNKDFMLGSMSAKQIQSLIANAVKAQLGKESHKKKLYTKPYTKRIDLFCIPMDINSPSLINSMGWAILRSTCTFYPNV